MTTFTITDFLGHLPSPPPTYQQPPVQNGQWDYLFSPPWVFWSEENHTDFQQLITSALSQTSMCIENVIVQFWAADTNGRLSTSGQPFAVGYLSEELALYRRSSEGYTFILQDGNNSSMFLGGAPASAYLERLPCLHEHQWPDDPDDSIAKISAMLPVCLPAQGEYCVGVLEITADKHSITFELFHYVVDIIQRIKEVGLDALGGKNIIHNLRNEIRRFAEYIQNALQVVCYTHNLKAAQIWFACKDETSIHPAISALKVGGCLNVAIVDEDKDYKDYFLWCDYFLLSGKEEPVLRTVLDRDTRIVEQPSVGVLENIGGQKLFKSGYIILCLGTDDDPKNSTDYTIELIYDSNTKVSLEDIMKTLEHELPRFRRISKFSKEVVVESRVLDKNNNWMLLQGVKSLDNSKGKGIAGVESSEDGRNDQLIVKAHYKNDIARFSLSIQEATFKRVDEEIRKELKLEVGGRYKLKYDDEDSDQILLSTDKDLQCCIKNAGTKKTEGILIRIHVYSIN